MAGMAFNILTVCTFCSIRSAFETQGELEQIEEKAAKRVAAAAAALQAAEQELRSVRAKVSWGWVPYVLGRSQNYS